MTCHENENRNRRTNHKGAFKNVRFLGSVEIKKSLVPLSSNQRSEVLGLGVKKILERFGRTNYFHTSDPEIVEMVGRSPMSSFNDSIVNIELTDESILVERNENAVISRLFEHFIQSISIATVDRNVATLYCYVTSQSNTATRGAPDRRLFLYECPDILQTKKIIEETQSKFRSSRDPPQPRTVQLPARSMRTTRIADSHVGGITQRRPKRRTPPPLPDQDCISDDYLNHN